MNLSFINCYGKSCCTCLRYCKGGKDVSYHTYHQHTHYQEESENAVIDKFLQESGPLAGIIRSGSSSKGTKGKAVCSIIFIALNNN